MSGVKTSLPSSGDHAYTVDTAAERGRKQSLGTSSRWRLARSKCLSTKASDRGQRGGPGAGKAAAPEHRLGRHTREDVLDDLVREVLVARRRRRRRRRRSFIMIPAHQGLPQDLPVVFAW